MEGRAVRLMVNPGTRQPMRHVGEAHFVVGQGIEGNKNFGSGRRTHRQVLLIDEETLDAVGMDPGVVKENITTSGLDLSSLRPGDVIELGNEVRLQITEPCEPCSRLDEVRDGLQAELAGRRGMLATIITGGIASTDDRIQVSDSELLPSE
ncbi:MAG: MOSC domain-containing protein [SAR202 cluster bacterium]|nr:MOSC domain-containing protein [SAR202 cluster bacterium]